MIPLVKTNLPPRELLMPALEQVLYSGYIALGKEVDDFEEGFRRFIGSGHSLALNSGTAALHIALILAGVKPGDIVISTPLTAEPTNVAIKMAGAKIRWADIDPRTGCLSVESVERQIDERVKAVMIVDYAGIPADVAGFQEIERKYNIPVIEDAAHALGAEYAGMRLGCHFDFVVFSLQAIKHMTTGDGGVLQLRNADVYDKGKLVRWFGLDKTKPRLEINIQNQGYKYHMNNINAAFGIVQLAKIEHIISTHIENGKYYDKELSGVQGVELLSYYQDSLPSYWLYTLKVDDRDNFIKKMSDAGIMASELHKRNDLHDYLNDFTAELPQMDEFYRKMVHIPCGWWVTDEDREYIAETIRQGW